jgi:large subunit ribosomal protein L32
MPNPKRRHSKRRTATRRAHDALTGIASPRSSRTKHKTASSSRTLSECPNCHERKLPHRACPKCGYYKGREVVEVKEAE